MLPYFNAALGSFFSLSMALKTFLIPKVDKDYYLKIKQHSLNSLLSL